MVMDAVEKQEIIKALDQLPEESVRAVAEFVDFLRAKTQTGTTRMSGATVGRLGGIWRGYSFSESDIDQVRREAWPDLGDDFG